MTGQTSLLFLPWEVVEHTLTFCSPLDVHAFALTSRHAYELVHGTASSHLWRQLFLFYPFDDPRISLRARDDPQFMRTFDWRLELQRRIMAGRLPLGTLPPHAHTHVLKYKLDTFISVLRGASPLSHGCESSHDLEWLFNMLRDSPELFETNIFISNSTSEGLFQLVAQLRSSFALSLDGGVKTNTRLRRQRSASRCMVYDLRNYHANNRWGPFVDGGKVVNWKHVEAIITVVLLNLSEIPARWRPPMGLQAARAYSAPGSLLHAQTDWAGVEGTWGRYVCFMDYQCVSFSVPHVCR
jgi:F-box domain